MYVKFLKTQYFPFSRHRFWSGRQYGCGSLPEYKGKAAGQDRINCTISSTYLDVSCPKSNVSSSYSFERGVVPYHEK